MKIEQVNTGTRTRLLVNGHERETGIFKTAQAGNVEVSEFGIPGDAICNARHHGGPDQAVYLYSVEDYQFWEELIGSPLPAGTFGENLTTSGQDLSDLCVGDLLASTSLCLQVTAPRIPCSTLATRMGDKQFAKKFMKAGRSGAYCRVLKAGSVTAGELFRHEPFEGDRIRLQEFFHDAKRKLDAAALRRYLAVPIDMRTRADFTDKLASSG